LKPNPNSLALVKLSILSITNQILYFE